MKFISNFKKNLIFTSKNFSLLHRNFSLPRELGSPGSGFLTAWLYVYVYVYVYRYKWEKFSDLCMYVFMYVCIHVYMYVCVYLLVYHKPFHWNIFIWDLQHSILSIIRSLTHICTWVTCTCKIVFLIWVNFLFKRVMIKK